MPTPSWPGNRRQSQEKGNNGQADRLSPSHSQQARKASARETTDTQMPRAQKEKGKTVLQLFKHRASEANCPQNTNQKQTV